MEILKSVWKFFFVIILGAIIVLFSLFILSAGYYGYYKLRYGREINFFGCDYLEYSNPIYLDQEYQLGQILEKANSDIEIDYFDKAVDYEQVSISFSDDEARHLLQFRKNRNTSSATIASYTIANGCNMTNRQVMAKTMEILRYLGIETDWLEYVEIEEVGGGFGLL